MSVEDDTGVYEDADKGQARAAVLVLFAYTYANCIFHARSWRRGWNILDDNSRNEAESRPPTKEGEHK